MMTVLLIDFFGMLAVSVDDSGCVKPESEKVIEAFNSSKEGRYS